MSGRRCLAPRPSDAVFRVTRTMVHVLATILHCKAILGRGQPGLMRWILWNMPLVQDRSLDLLTSSPVRYHCATDAPWLSTICSQLPLLHKHDMYNYYTLSRALLIHSPLVFSAVVHGWEDKNKVRVLELLYTVWSHDSPRRGYTGPWTTYGVCQRIWVSCKGGAVATKNKVIVLKLRKTLILKTQFILVHRYLAWLDTVRNHAHMLLYVCLQIGCQTWMKILLRLISNFIVLIITSNLHMET